MRSDKVMSHSLPTTTVSKLTVEKVSISIDLYYPNDAQKFHIHLQYRLELQFTMNLLC